jgi:hypothetical protein
MNSTLHFLNIYHLYFPLEGIFLPSNQSCHTDGCGHSDVNAGLWSVCDFDAL